MTSGQSTVRLTRYLAKSMELENYVSPAKKARMQDVIPSPTPDSKVIVLDAEPGLDHYELGVQNKPLMPAQKLSMKGTTRFELPTAVNYNDEEIEFLKDLFDALHKEVQSTCAPPQIKEFSLTTPEVPTQRHKNDSGIWVCV
ncbi:unnamed protein product [Linum trigynum]|uniref:Uncharacterized protein n=1 Tax=Linum trigynum TaxID=586398 RepID=A0AAV2FBF6_9ROSI